MTADPTTRRGRPGYDRESLLRVAVAVFNDRGYDGTVTDLVRQAIAEGGVRPDVDAATTARLLFGMVNSLIEWYRPDRGHDVTEIADTVVAVAFQGLRPR